VGGGATSLRGAQPTRPCDTFSVSAASSQRLSLQKSARPARHVGPSEHSSAPLSRFFCAHLISTCKVVHISRSAIYIKPPLHAPHAPSSPPPECSVDSALRSRCNELDSATSPYQRQMAYSVEETELLRVQTESQGEMEASLIPSQTCNGECRKRCRRGPPRQHPRIQCASHRQLATGRRRTRSSSSPPLMGDHVLSCF
jgi:hypothetical protein